MQFGPTIRIPESLTISSSLASSSAPSPPTSANPADITTIPRTPASAHWVTTSKTNLCGTTTKARSTSSGMSAMVGYALTDRTTRELGLTG